MCGIFGFYQSAGAPPPPGLAEAMGQTLVHRGPDDVGIFTRPGVALGNRRLSIIDVAGGHQPFVSADGKVGVVQNGEIFNHVELARELAGSGHPCATHSDTEVLLRLYERDGIDMARRLNGMFAFALWDGRSGDLHLVRDRIGVKPLYLYDDGARLLFASEIKALLRAGVPRRLNEEALHHFLTYNYVPPPLTMFEGVVHLPPGHRLRVSGKNRTMTRWWDLSSQRPLERSEGEWIAEFNDVLDDAVRLRLRSDVPFGAFLSGGVDSSTVVGVMRRHLKEPVRAYSIGFHEERFDESPFAVEAAQRFGARHVLRKVDANMLDLWPLVTWHNDQPHGDISFLPTYRVSQLAAEEVKVVLTGDGADELFAGYDKYKAFFTGRGADVAPDPVFHCAYYENISLFSDADKGALYAPALADRLRGVESSALLAPLFEESAGMDRINQALYIDARFLLPGNNLVKPDRMGMAVSIEARTPFLDYRMMELAFRMPGAMKLAQGETKYIYKKAVRPLIGDGLTDRKKTMFTVPVGEWFRDRLGPFLEAVLLSHRTHERGVFRPEAVRGLIEDHRAGRANRTRELRALIAVELWARIFLDGDGARCPGLADLGLDPGLVRAGEGA